MPLTLLCGPFHPTLEDALVDRLRALRPGPGNPVAVVTASREMSDRLQILLARERGLSFLNVRFLTLHALALDVLKAAGDPLPRVVNDPLFHEAWMEHLLREEGAPPDRARALAGAHRETVRDMLDAGVDPAHFREHFGDLDLPQPEAWDRLLALTQRARERLTAAGVATSADLARQATARVETDPRVLAGAAHYFYYGFYDLNGAQLDFFTAVARAVPVTLFFPYRADCPEWAFAEKFLNGVTGLAGARVEHLPDSGAPRPRPRVVSVSGERDEMWWVAKEILRLREGPAPVPWDAIGVVARGGEPYASWGADVLAAHGIPHAVSDGGPALAVPAVRWFLDLLRLSLRPHDRDLLADVLAAPFAVPALLPPGPRGALLAYVRTAGPRAGWGWIRDQRARPGGPPDQDGEENTHLPTEPPPGLEPLLALFSEIAPTPASWDQHLLRVRSFWARCALPFSGDDAGAPASPEEDSGLSEAARLLEPLLSTLGLFDLFSPPVEWAECVGAVERGLSRLRRPGTGPTRGVRVRGVMEARGESFEVLFLVGLKEGVFPRVIREDPLLSDDMRRFLRDPGGYWILPKLEGYDEEKLLFAGAVASCRNRLYCLYSRSRADGRAEVPSLYLRDLVRAEGLSWDAGDRLPRAPLEKWKSVPSSFRTEQEAGLLDVLEGKTPVEASWVDLRERAAVLSTGGAPGPWDGILGDSPSLRARLARRGLTPSGYETYGRCPFRLFLSRWVGVRAPSPAVQDGGLAPWARGDAQHRALQRFYRGLSPSTPLTPGACAERIHTAVEEVFEKASRLGAALYPLMEQAVRNQMEQDLVRFVLKDLTRLKAEGYWPREMEWALSRPGGPGPAWAGRLDRVDWNPVSQTYWVVDYKNAPTDRSLADRVAAGEVHQAPMYLELLAAAAPWGAQARPAGVRYEFLAANETETFTAEQWEAATPAVRAGWARLDRALTEGRYPIRPDESPGGVCRFCEFSRACRKAHPPSRRRSERASPGMESEDPT